MKRNALLSGLLMMTVMANGGCAIGSLIGGMAQNAEREKKIEVLAEYRGLADKTVAVLVEIDPYTMYEHPQLAMNITSGVVDAIMRNVPEAVVMPAQLSMQWQYSTPGWNAMTFSEMAQSIHRHNVRAYGQNASVKIDRIIHIEVIEYRLHPPGNRYEWDGVCAANVRVLEIDPAGLDPEFPVLEKSIVGKFPDIQGVGWESASADRIGLGVLARFVEKTAWVFYDHQEWKYPDQRPKGATL